MNWVAHSQGGAIFAEAVRYNGGDLSQNGVVFHSGANNEWVTNYYLDQANINEQYQGQETTYRNSPIDIVPNIIGLNTLNPISIIGSILAIRLLFTDPEHSPHTLPHGWNAQGNISQEVR